MSEETPDPAPDEPAAPVAAPSTEEGTAVGDGDAEAPEEDLVGRAEALADRTLSAFVDKVDLPDVRAEAEKAIGFFRSIDSWSMWLVLLAFLAAAGSGVAVVLTGFDPIGALPDWYMHLAMYVVMFSFLVLYIKAHLMTKRVTRAVMALITLALYAFFAWILFDRVPARTLVVVEAGVPQALERPTLANLAIPAWLLIVAGATLLAHWVVLARFRRRAATIEERIESDEAAGAEVSG